ncbi:MAG: murein biosynthesis integral membrane protein MurJ [Pirellulales bacterium]
MERREPWRLRSGFWVTALATLGSRVLGLARDMVTAALLGLGSGGVMDAFVIAFRVPNLLRRLFGEGALAASFLPVFTAQSEHDPRRGWQLFSVLLVWLAIGLSAVALVGEAACAAWWWWGDGDPSTGQLVELLAIMLPYLVFICLAAQASAALQALFEFRLPALVPALLNVCWLVAAILIAPRFAPDKLAQARVIAAAVLVSGVLQFAVQLPALVRLGFRFDYDWRAGRESFWLVVRSMVPVTLGMAVTQLNTLADSLIAWGLAAEPGGPTTIVWLGNTVAYPLRSGAAAAIYYGERFYQLPVGILGVAIATVTFPLLSRHAARGDRAAVAADLTLGLRLVAFLALPAGIGMILVAQPAARVLFERGVFTADDAARAARMIAAYASGVWAYCAIVVLVRAFYALGNRVAPARLGLIAVLVNLALNLTLIWPLAEVGLAVSTSLAAGLQVALLATTFSRNACPLAWRELATTVAKSAVSSVAMAAAVAAVLHVFGTAHAAQSARLAVPLVLAIGAGVAVYLAAAWLLRMPELSLLLARSGRGPASDASEPGPAPPKQ